MHFDFPFLVMFSHTYVCAILCEMEAYQVSPKFPHAYLSLNDMPTLMNQFVSIFIERQKNSPKFKVAI